MIKILLPSILLTFTSVLQAEFHQKEFAVHTFTFESGKEPDKRPKHSPKKATIMSMVLPGLGQVYNEKYWKVPIIYAALGISGYFIIDNRKEMLLRQNALKLLLDNDSSSNPPAAYARIPENVLKAQRDYYRTNRDYSIIAFAGFYFLNVIDAAVDAHFYKFNIDKPLAARRVKKWNLYSDKIGRTATIGISWRF